MEQKALIRRVDGGFIVTTDLGTTTPPTYVRTGLDAALEVVSQYYWMEITEYDAEAIQEAAEALELESESSDV